MVAAAMRAAAAAAARRQSPPKLLTIEPTFTLFKPAVEVGAAYLRVASAHRQRLDGAPKLPSEDTVSKAFLQEYRRQKERSPCFGHGDMPSVQWWEETIRATFSSTGMLPYFEDSFDELYHSTFDGSASPEQGGFWRLHPDADAALRAFRGSGVTLACLTNWDERYHGMLHNLGLAEHFDFVHVSGETGMEKGPEALAHALRTASEIRGEEVAAHEAVHVGLSASRDVLAALDAGWDSVYLGEATMEIDGVFGLPLARIQHLAPTVGVGGEGDEVDGGDSSSA